jgi:hypothetical protein
VWAFSSPGAATRIEGHTDSVDATPPTRAFRPAARNRFVCIWLTSGSVGLRRRIGTRQRPDRPLEYGVGPESAFAFGFGEPAALFRPALPSFLTRRPEPSILENNATCSHSAGQSALPFMRRADAREPALHSHRKKHPRPARGATPARSSKASSTEKAHTSGRSPPDGRRGGP